MKNEINGNMALENLNFLTLDDLSAQIIDQFLIERSGEDTQTILETIESQQIEVIKTKLQGRYDSDAVFNASGTERHWLIFKILSNLVVYYFIRRNAARKVPTDYREEWEWAMKQLEKINAGRITPDGLPVITDTDGNPAPPIMHGNNSNRDFYL